MLHDVPYSHACTARAARTGMDTGRKPVRRKLIEPGEKETNQTKQSEANAKKNVGS